MTNAGAGPVEDDSPTSSSLLLRVQAQQAGAWERLVTLYSPLVYRWCRQAGLQPTDAADIGQEVFRSVARKVTEFRHGRAGDTFRGWLRTITRHKIIDHLRTEPRERTGSDAIDRASWRPDSCESGLAPADEARMVYHQAVRLIQSEFEERSWQAFWRVAVDEAAPADVARELGLSLNAVYLAKSRILRRLREEFEELVETDAP